MKRKWVILCILLSIVLIGGGAAVMITNLIGRTVLRDELESCDVSTGGGMLGGYREVRLTRDADGNAVLRIREKQTHADREITTQYPVADAAFDRLREITVQYNLYGASKRPYSKIRALDADTTSVSFDFKKGDFRVSEEQVLSRRMREGFREVIRYLDSLAVGEGVTTKAPQRAFLLLRGYTLQFIVEEPFDGRLDDILSEDREVSAFGSSGIVLASDVRPDLTGAAAAKEAAAGDIVYDAQNGQIIVLYADCTFAQPVYRLAALDGYVQSACPLIAEMEGEYYFRLD